MDGLAPDGVFAPYSLNYEDIPSCRSDLLAAAFDDRLRHN